MQIRQGDSASQRTAKSDREEVPATKPPPPPATHPVEEVLAEKDARYFNLAPDLPSRMSFYGYDSLSVRPYELGELIKLGAAKRSGKVRYVVEAVAATIDKPVGGLLMCDFMYICYWLRLASFKKTPFTFKWLCEATNHRFRVLQGELLPGTLENSMVLTDSNVQIRGIEPEKIRALLDSLLESGVAAYPQTVATFLEVEELTRNGKDISDEHLFLMPFAAILDVSHGTKLADRIRYLESLQKNQNSIDIFEELSKVSEYFKTLGVHEALSVMCQHCQVKQEITPEVDLLSFFPFGD